MTLKFFVKTLKILYCQLQIYTEMKNKTNMYSYTVTLETLRIKMFSLWILPRVIWTVLATFFFLGALRYTVSIFSVRWWNVILPSQFRSAASILFFAFQCRETSPRVPLRQHFFADIPSSGMSSSLLSQPFSLFFCFFCFCFFFFKILFIYFFYWLIDWLIDCYVGSSFLC